MKAHKHLPRLSSSEFPSSRQARYQERQYVSTEQKFLRLWLDFTVGMPFMVRILAHLRCTPHMDRRFSICPDVQKNGGLLFDNFSASAELWNFPTQLPLLSFSRLSQSERCRLVSPFPFIINFVAILSSRYSSSAYRPKRRPHWTDDCQHTAWIFFAHGWDCEYRHQRTYPCQQSFPCELRKFNAFRFGKFICAAIQFRESCAFLIFYRWQRSRHRTVCIFSRRIVGRRICMNYAAFFL